MAFLLRAASAKGQTPLKLGSGALNADMTFTRPFGMLVLDGVSGVSEEGLEPAAFPREKGSRFSLIDCGWTLHCFRREKV